MSCSTYAISAKKRIKNPSNLAFAMEGVLLCVVGVVGLVGNATAIAVFSRQRVQRNFHSLMVGLALFDATYIIMRYFKL